MTVSLAITRRTTASLLGMKRLVGFGLLELGPALIYFASSSRVADSELPERVAAFALSLYFPVVVPVVAIVLASNALGGERRDETLSFLVLRPVSRTGIAAAKLIGASLAAVVINAIGALGLGAVHVAIGGDANVAVPFLIGGTVATLAYTALFVPFGFVTERAVIIGLIFLFVFEGAIVSALDGLATFSPWRIGFSAFAGSLPAGMAENTGVADIVDIALGSVAAGTGGAIVKTVVLGILAVAATASLLRSRDLA